MNADNDTPSCWRGYDKMPYGSWHCDSWYCPRCQRIKRSHFANLLLADFRKRDAEWFRTLYFAVFRPCRSIQSAPFQEGIVLAVAVLKEFHKLLRRHVEYTHFSLTEDTSLDKRSGKFVPDIHTHALVRGGGLSKALVRNVFVQVHENVLGSGALDADERRSITVYFRPCRRPFRAALYVTKHGKKYRTHAREFRSVDLTVHKKNPVRVEYIRRGKGLAFFSKPVEELAAEVARQREEYKQQKARERRQWSPSSENTTVPCTEGDQPNEVPTNGDILVRVSLMCRDAGGNASKIHVAKRLDSFVPNSSRRCCRSPPWSHSDARPSPVLRWSTERRGSQTVRHGRGSPHSTVWRKPDVGFGRQKAVGGSVGILHRRERAAPLGRTTGLRRPRSTSGRGRSPCRSTRVGRVHVDRGRHGH